MEDIDVVRQVKSGDIEVFSILVEKYHRHLLNFICRLVGDEEIVEDIGQEVFLSIYKSLKDFDENRGTPFSAWALCFFITGTANFYIRDNVFALYKIPVDYHQPVVLKGDRVIADKTAYKRMPPEKGDIVVFVFPDDRRKVFLRRIAGLPGDVLNLESEQEYTVPHGTLFMLCESRKDSHCRDSKDFGPVPIRDVIGKVRQVIYSYGADGMRWNRVGETFDKLP